MSMIGMLRRLPNARLVRLQAEPDGILEYLNDDGGDENEPFADLDIDSSWHAIHFLLNGSASKETVPGLGFLLTGGTEIGEDNGYGAVRGFRPDEVKVIQRALAPIDAATIRARFDPKALEANDIYPSGAWKEVVGEPEFWMDYFEQMKAFIEGAVENGESLLVWIS